MKILFIKSVFCPNKSHLSSTFNGLHSLLNMLSCKNNYDISLYLIGWVPDEKYGRLLKKLINNFNCDINIMYEFYKINYGKYYILNQIIKIAEKYDVISYSDHDIIYENNLHDIISSYNTINNKICNNKKIGLIVLNHKEDIRHQFYIYNNTCHIDNICVLYTNHQDVTSIATGAFVANGKLFSSLNKFGKISVYGLDDTALIKQVLNLNYITVVLRDIYVIHPYSYDLKYKKWKEDNVLKTITGEIEYNRNIEESLNYWSLNKF